MNQEEEKEVVVLHTIERLRMERDRAMANYARLNSAAAGLVEALEACARTPICWETASKSLSKFRKAMNSAI